MNGPVGLNLNLLSIRDNPGIISDNEIRERSKFSRLIEIENTKHIEKIKLFQKFIAFDQNLLKKIGNIKSRALTTTLITNIKYLYEKLIEETIKYDKEKNGTVKLQSKRSWKIYFQFLKLKSPQDLSATIKKMLPHFCEDLECCLIAIQWEFIGNPNYCPENLENCIKLCSYGDYHQRTCNSLFKYYGLDKQTLSPVVNDVGKRRHSFDYTNFFYELQKLLDSLNVPQKEFDLQWNKLADRVWMENLSSSCVTDELISSYCNVYKTALRKSNSTRLFILYVEAMFKLSQQHSYSMLARKEFIQSLQTTKEFTLDNYLLFIDHLIKMKDENNRIFIFKMFESGVQKYKHSKILWKKYLLYKMYSDNEKDVRRIFYSARKCLSPVDTIPLWNLYISYLTTIQNSEEQINSIYLEASAEINPAYNELKLDYKDWLIFNKAAK